MIKRIKKSLISGIAILSSVLLSFTVLVPISLNYKRKKSHAATVIESSSFGLGLIDGEYIVNSDVTITGYETGNNGITIDENSTVVITINKNCTLTTTGRNAGYRTWGHGEKHYYGGGAGIYVPSSSNLILKGEGTVIATGGNASNGSNGSNGTDAYTDNDGFLDLHTSYYCGSGGSGGRGGSGAGAGIGGSGGVGGSGGSSAGANGSNGSSGTTSGKICILGNLIVTATSGANGIAGSGGIKGSNQTRTEKTTGGHDGPGETTIYLYAGGGGGGGGGAGSAPTYDIGNGGSGGGGGAAASKIEDASQPNPSYGGNGGNSLVQGQNGLPGGSNTFTIDEKAGSGGSAGRYTTNSCVYYSSGVTINGSYLGTCITSTATFDDHCKIRNGSYDIFGLLIPKYDPVDVISIKEGETELTGDALSFLVAVGSFGLTLTDFNFETHILASIDYQNNTLTYTFTDFYNTRHTIVYYIENTYYISDTDIPSSFNDDETITPTLDYKTYEFVFE